MLKLKIFRTFYKIDKNSELFKVLSILAKQVFKQFPELREELWGGEFWSDGGHIDTVGDGKGLDAIKKYVINQGQDANQLTLHAF